MKINITNNINYEYFDSLGSDLLFMPKTKIYAINKFEFEDREYIVVMVEYYNPLTTKSKDVMMVWDSRVLINSEILEGLWE